MSSGLVRFSPGSANKIALNIDQLFRRRSLIAYLAEESGPLSAIDSCDATLFSRSSKQFFIGSHSIM